MLEMIIGGALVTFGYLAGRISRPARKAKTSLSEAMCSCRHTIAFHDPLTNFCHGKKKEDKYDKEGMWSGEKYVPCTCRQYDGPTPLPAFYAPEITE